MYLVKNEKSCLCINGAANTYVSIEYIPEGVNITLETPDAEKDQVLFQDVICAHNRRVEEYFDVFGSGRWFSFRISEQKVKLSVSGVNVAQFYLSRLFAAMIDFQHFDKIINYLDIVGVGCYGMFYQKAQAGLMGLDQGGQHESSSMLDVIEKQAQEQQKLIRELMEAQRLASTEERAALVAQYDKQMKAFQALEEDRRRLQEESIKHTEPRDAGALIVSQVSGGVNALAKRVKEPGKRRKRWANAARSIGGKVYDEAKDFAARVAAEVIKR